MCLEKGNYAQIEALKLTLSNAINCTRNAKIPGLRDRFRFEIRYDEGNFNIARSNAEKKEHLVFQSGDMKHWNCM